MTANEAGEQPERGLHTLSPVPPFAVRCKDCGEEWDDGPPFSHDCPNVQFAEFEAEPYGIELTPSKPCTEGGSHCFCVGPTNGTLCYMQCCWCNHSASHRLTSQRVPGHGPYRTELVRE